MRQTFARGRWPLAWLMLCALMSAMLFMPVPRPARAQQDSSRQLKHEENKQTPARRLALVIGNGAYQNAPVLKNPANDATDMAQALSDVGFAVEHGVNLTQKQMKLMIREFGQRLREGGQGLFYFAGHGVQLKGRNYLIPVEAEIQSEADVEDQGVDASLVLNLMDEANNGLNVVILDACRNNPFARSFRSASNGLAQVDAPTGTLIAYSTAPGRVARDGTGRNGAYTAELLKQLRVPGLGIEELLKRVRASLKQQTNGEQVPWESSSLVGDFYLNRATNVTSASTSAPIVNPAAVELEYWETIKNSTDAEDFREYLKEYPSGLHAVIARSNLRRLEAAAKSNASEAKPTGTVPAPSTTSTTKTAAAEGNTARPTKGSGARLPVPASMLRNFEYLTLTLDESGKLKTQETKRARQYAENLSGVPLEMVQVPGGSFHMGSSDADVQAAFEGEKRYEKYANLARFATETPRHRVSVPDFFMGKYEVTQSQWRAVMGTEPSNFKGDDLPVEQVSWDEAVEFCKRLSEKTGREYRLPSEAEWEYAARAGTTTLFAFGETVTPETVNYKWNYPYANAAKGSNQDKTMTVGWSGTANAFGLYDMHGNVWEWCLDYWHESYGGAVKRAPTDGSAWLSGGDSDLRVMRGGAWTSFGYNCRSAVRYGENSGSLHNYLGFRVVVSART